MSLVTLKTNILHRRRKLQVDLFIIFIGFFLITTGSIISYNYVVESRAELNLADQLISLNEEKLINNINHYLKPMGLVNIVASMISADNFSWLAKQKDDSFIYAILKSYPQLIRVRIADTQGHYIAISNVQPGQLVTEDARQIIPAHTQFITSSVSPTDQHWIFKDQEGRVLNSMTQKINSASQHSSWYVGATQHPDNYWLHSYFSPTLHQAVINVSYPILNNYGNIMGVIDTEIAADNLNDFLRKYQQGDHSEAYIINEHNKIIGHMISNNNNSLPNLNLLNINKISADPFVKAYQHFNATANDKFSFTDRHQLYLAQFKHFFQDVGDDWDIGMIVPADNFIGSLKKANQLSIIFAGLIIAIGTMIIVMIARAISKPIVALTQEMAQIQKFHLDNAFTVRSHIVEVNSMTRALAAVKTSLRSFARYVPTELVRTLILKNEVATVGSHKKNLTLLFTDIANFTEIVEKMEPDALGGMLSDYLEHMTAVIKQQRGTIDKYIGDAIMAFWGAPLDDRDQVSNACRATLLCAKTLTHLNQLWLSQGKPMLPTRFGLHAGNVMVGNLGSSDRLNYTVIGEPVTLAARLESINKKYGTRIMVSETIYRAVSDKFLFRPIDVLLTQTKKQPIVIYELMASYNDGPSLQPTSGQLELARLTQLGFENFQQKNEVLARQFYQEAHTKFPDDGVAQLFASDSAPRI